MDIITHAYTRKHVYIHRHIHTDRHTHPFKVKPGGSIGGENAT